MLDLVRAIANVNPADPARNLLRLPARHEADELGQLAQSLNALLVAFEQGLAQRDSATEALGTLNRELEARIHERTRALENTMTELEAKRLDAEQASQAKSQFLATMSHEIRTPLNGILGMAQLLMMPGLNPQEQQDYARTILNSGRTLLSLLNDILDLSKVEAGKLELQLTPFDCARLLAEVATLFAEPARAKGLTLETRCGVAAAGRFRGDAVRLRQMLSNLVSNAIKFSDQGTILIEAGAERSNGAQAELLFSVTDRGIGIAPEDQARLFQAFSQVDGSNTRKYGGTGLGLSIVQRLARLMHGDVGVDSVLGRGARFWFRVQVEPIAAGDDSRQTERLIGQPEPILLPNGEVPRVLVVEDDATNQRLIQAMLEKLGALPVIVADGRAAVDTLGGGFLPDLVLMDCQMPVMDGYEATRLWRQQEQAGGQRLPIIALTANVYEENRQRCQAAGMDDFLAKPVHLQALAGMLNKWLRNADSAGRGVGYPAAGGEPVLFDGADFFDRFGGDRELMACVIDIYLAEWPQSLAELDAALAAGDLVAVHRLAHALKGACGNVSGLALAALAARIESAAAAGDLVAVRAAVSALAVAAKGLDQSLRALRAEWQVAES